MHGVRLTVAGGAVAEGRSFDTVNGVARAAGDVFAGMVLEDGNTGRALIRRVAIDARRDALVRSEDMARKAGRVGMTGHSRMWPRLLSLMAESTLVLMTFRTRCCGRRRRCARRLGRSMAIATRDLLLANVKLMHRRLPRVRPNDGNELLGRTRRCSLVHREGGKGGRDHENQEQNCERGAVFHRT